MNYAFIDSQNLNLGVKSLGWNLDYNRFRIYLKEKYKVEIAYLFIGYIPQNQDLYDSLQKAGYVLKFKQFKINFFLSGILKSSIANTGTGFRSDNIVTAFKLTAACVNYSL